MKKLLLSAVMMLVTAFAAQAKFEEGKHYTVISKSAEAKQGVQEYFSFYCPHCYTFERGFVPGLKKQLSSKNISFSQNHVDFINPNGRDRSLPNMGVEATRAFAIAHQLGVDTEFKNAFFTAIHDKRQRFVTPKDIKAVFLAIGVTNEKYEAAAKSFMVNTKMNLMKSGAAKARLRGVPSFVVNEKYLVNNSSVQNYQELQELIVYLTDK